MQGKKKEAAQKEYLLCLRSLKTRIETIEILGREMINLPIPFFH